MVKTIDDIIEAKDSELYAMGCGQTYVNAYCDGIRFGANAVLKEIEIVVTCNEDNTLNMARCLVDKIKELKGEAV